MIDASVAEYERDLERAVRERDDALFLVANRDRLIDRNNAEINILRGTLEAAEAHCTELRAEIERLRKPTNLFGLLEAANAEIKQLRAELQDFEADTACEDRVDALESAAREVTSWDWAHLLVDHPDAETVKEDVQRLEMVLNGQCEARAGLRARRCKLPAGHECPHDCTPEAGQ